MQPSNPFWITAQTKKEAEKTLNLGLLRQISVQELKERIVERIIIADLEPTSETIILLEGQGHMAGYL